MTGEMAGELKALMEKAKGVLEKTAQVDNGTVSEVDMIKLLIKFLNDKVIGRT